MSAQMWFQPMIGGILLLVMEDVSDVSVSIVSNHVRGRNKENVTIVLMRIQMNRNIIHLFVDMLLYRDI